MADTTIRPLAASDHSAWDGLWRAYLAYYETELSADVRQAAFEKLLDPASKAHGLVALINGEPVGLTHYIFHDHLWRPDGICYLQDLFTTPAARGQGVGSQLIKAVYAAADNAGVPKVYWMTQDFNAAARKVYDNVGKLTPFIRYDRP